MDDKTVYQALTRKRQVDRAQHNMISIELYSLHARIIRTIRTAKQISNCSGVRYSALDWRVDFC